MTHKNAMKIGFISKGFPAVYYWVITIFFDISNPLHVVRIHFFPANWDTKINKRNTNLVQKGTFKKLLEHGNIWTSVSPHYRNKEHIH